MLLSDRDIRAEIDSGRVGLDPYEPDMVQPSSIDVRHRPLLPGLREPPLSAHRPRGGAARPDPAGRARRRRAVHPAPGRVRARRRPTRSSPCPTTSRPGSRARARSGRLGLLTHSTAGLHRPRVLRPRDARAVQRRDPADQAVAGHEDRPAVLLPAAPARPSSRTARARNGSRYQGQRGPTPSRSLPELPPHPDLRARPRRSAVDVGQRPAGGERTSDAAAATS